MDEDELKEKRLKRDENESENDLEKEKKHCTTMPPLVQHNDFQFPGVPASPPRFTSLDQVMKAAETFKQLALAHEIAVNEDFVLKKSGPLTGIEKQVDAVVRKAFWDVLQQQLNETPPDFTHALTLLEEIKENLKGLLLLPHQTRSKSQIDEMLDLNLIKQQVENGALDFNYYSKLIISTMSRMCAPARDENIRQLSTLTEVVPLYKGILETLDLMKIDMANFTLQQMRPQIQQHSIEYEKEKFKDILSTLSGLTPRVDGLALTRKWFEKVYNNIMCADSSSLAAKSEISDQEIITKAYLELLQWKNNERFPETIELDGARFLNLSNQLAIILLSASTALVTYSIVGEAIQGISSFKEKLKDHLFILLKDASFTSQEELDQKLQSIALQVTKEVNECLKEHGYNELDEQRTSMLMAQITDISSENHAIKKLILKRVLEFVEQILNSSNTSSVKFPVGLSAFHKELSGLVGQYLQLVHHNQAVFGDYYKDILADVRKNWNQQT